MAAWRTNAIRIVLFASPDRFDQGGDRGLRLASEGAKDLSGGDGGRVIGLLIH